MNLARGDFVRRQRSVIVHRLGVKKWLHARGPAKYAFLTNLLQLVSPGKVQPRMQPVETPENTEVGAESTLHRKRKCLLARTTREIRETLERVRAALRKIRRDAETFTWQWQGVSVGLRRPLIHSATRMAFESW
jgi:hypothetical protein